MTDRRLHNRRWSPRWWQLLVLDVTNYGWEKLMQTDQFDDWLSMQTPTIKRLAFSCRARDIATTVHLYKAFLKRVEELKNGNQD